jgi:predicted enzyme related to lactoylglutathione lyase
VDRNGLKVQSQITFLYYRDLEPIARFYQEVMGFELVEDQGWAKIYRVSGNAYLGIVDEAMGFHKAQERNAVLITLAVDDVFRWYDYLKGKGVKLLTEPRDVEDIQVRCFFLEDPGGYAIEIEEFLKPEATRIFHS